MAVTAKLSEGKSGDPRKGEPPAMLEIKQPSYVHGASPVPLIGKTIGVFFDEAAARWAEREALIVCHQGVRWSFRELQGRVDALAAGLIALGLTPGERIGIWSPNNAEWLITQFATAKAGLVLVNINPAYRLPELEYALNTVGCAALITAPSFKTSNYIDMLGELLPELEGRSPAAASAATPAALDPDPPRRGALAGHAQLRRDRRLGGEAERDAAR